MNAQEHREWIRLHNDAAGVLTLAKGILQEQGWTQHVCADKDGRVCASFAYLLAREFAQTSAAEDAWRHLTSALELLGLPPAVAAYNDESCRTKEEILALFDSAINLATADVSE